jgi:hypothetical protein
MPEGLRDSLETRCGVGLSAVTGPVPGGGAQIFTRAKVSDTQLGQVGSVALVNLLQREIALVYFIVARGHVLRRIR